MKTKDLKDFAPEFNVKHSGWLSRIYGWMVVVIILVMILGDAALHNTAVPTLEKAPGIGKLLKEFGFGKKQ